jgi:hypothetical protein
MRERAQNIHIIGITLNQQIIVVLVSVSRVSAHGSESEVRLPACCRTSASRASSPPGRSG